MSRILRILLVLLAILLTAAMTLASEPGSQAGKDTPTTTTAKKAFDAPPPVGAKAVCPVMGHEFTVAKNTVRSEHKGKHYVFCCPGCKPKFDADPGKYTDKK